MLLEPQELPDGFLMLRMQRRRLDGSGGARAAIPAGTERLLGLADRAASILNAPDDDPAIRNLLANVFKSRSRAEWQRVFEGTDACVSPVLDMDEARTHEQNRAGGTFSEVDGLVHPNPPPRFSRSRTQCPDQPGYGEIDPDALLA